MPAKTTPAKNRKPAKPAATTAATATLLAAAAFASPIQVDAATGTIRNVAVMTVGPTLGYPFSIDHTTLLQAMQLINRDPAGVKVRYKHPAVAGGKIADDLGTTVGRLSNARIDDTGNVLRGDLRMGDYAANLPGLGDARAYLLGIAAADPAAIGLSAVIHWTPEETDAGIVARLADLTAVDFVGRAAANPNGLLAANEETNQPPAPKGGKPLPQQGDSMMTDEMKQALFALGLDEDATDDEAQEFYDNLSDDQRAQLDATSGDGEPAVMGADAPAPNPAIKPAPGTPGKQTPKPAPAKPAPMSARVDPGLGLVAQERSRVTQISALGAVLKVDSETIGQSIGEGHTIQQARVAMLAALKKNMKPHATIIVGRDQNITSLQAALPDAIMLRADAKVEKPHERAQKLRAMTVINMGRQYLAALGATDVWELSNTRMAELLLSRGQLQNQYPQVAALAQSVGDFPNLLANTVGRTLRQAYLDAKPTWPLWARRATAPDFRPVIRTNSSEMPSLTKADQGKGISYVTLGDTGEQYVLDTYQNGIRLTRKAMINDDMSAFGRIPTLQAAACARLEDDLAYGVITNNANMSDTVALFHATHKNLVSGASNLAPPNVQSISAVENLLFKAVGPKGAARLEIKLAVLLVPSSLKGSTEGFLGSQQLLAVVSTASTAPVTVGSANPYNGKFVVVPSARLDDASNTAWYGLGDYRTGIDTVEVAFLQDEPEPVLRQETDFDTQDVKLAVRHNAAAKAIDFRAMVKNPGQ